MEIGNLVEAVRTLNANDAFRPRIGLEHWRMLAPYLTRCEVGASEVLIRQGEVERTMYLLERGNMQVYVTRKTPATTQRIAILRPGAVVGEAGLFSDGPRMANVEAMTPCTAWALRGPRFEELAARVPALAFEIVRASAAVLAARLRANLENDSPVS